MITKETKTQLRKLVKKDEDFCVAPTANNSMNEMCRRHPGEWPIGLAIRTLVLTDEEYKAVYIDAVGLLRKALKVDTDAQIG